MVFIQLFRWIGRRIGWVLQESWNGVKALAKFIILLLLIIIGSILAFVGHLVLLLLGLFVSVCIVLLKGFAWFTQKLMVSTSWFGEKLSDCTDAFFGGITEMFDQQEEDLNKEINLIIRAERL